MCARALAERLRRGVISATICPLRERSVDTAARAALGGPDAARLIPAKSAKPARALECLVDEQPARFALIFAA
jgi:hypothetical protein